MLQDIFLSGGTTPNVPKRELMNQWDIPDTTAFIGKLFHHEIPSSAFSGRLDECKVINFRVSFVLALWIVPCTVPNSCHTHFYRPQRSHSVHGGGGVCPSACWDTHKHPGQTPPTPSAKCILGYTLTLPSACSDRRGYCCGRYTSYWNAFL